MSKATPINCIILYITVYSILSLHNTPLHARLLWKSLYQKVSKTLIIIKSLPHYVTIFKFKYCTDVTILLLVGHHILIRIGLQIVSSLLNWSLSKLTINWVIIVTKMSIYTYIQKDTKCIFSLNQSFVSIVTCCIFYDSIT